MICFFLYTEIEERVRELQNKRSSLRPGDEDTENTAPAKTAKDMVGLGVEGNFDTEIYESRNSKFAGYVTSIPATDEVEVK